MRKIGFFTVILLVIVSSCSNHLDVLDPIDPIPVVYFQINPADKIFYLTLTRSFSGDGNGYDLAGDANQVFYDGADIRLEVWSDQYKVWETQFEPTSRTKIPGLFPEVPGYCYETANEFLFLGLITSFRLMITVPRISSPVFSRIPVLSELLVPSRFDHEIALYPDVYKFGFADGGGPGVQYRQLLCEFHYQEYEGTWVDHSVTFTIRKDIIIPGGDLLYPELFFNKLTQNISPINDTILRKFISIDLIFLVGDQYFKDYLDTYENAGNLDLSPEGNISNGYGLFTMVRSVRKENMKLSRQTFDSLCLGAITRKLGFVRW
jgi:hypothetical protein